MRDLLTIANDQVSKAKDELELTPWELSELQNNKQIENIDLEDYEY